MELPPRIVSAVDMTVNGSAGAATTTTLAIGTRFIRLVSDIACRFAFANTVTATTGILIPANVEVFLQVPNSQAQAAQDIATLGHTTTAGKLNVAVVTS